MSANGQPGVVITGIGAVSPFGVGRESLLASSQPRHQRVSSDHAVRCVVLSLPRCCLGSARHHRSKRCRSRARTANGRADPKRYSRAALFGVIAAREAWCDAGLRAGEPNAGVLIGSGGGGIDVGEKQYQDFFTTGGRHVTPYAIAVGICGMVSSEISIALRLRGISHVLSCGCTSSTDAIGYAASLIRSGEYDVLLSGGTDGCVLPGMIFGFSRMRAVSTHYNDRPAEASRPFDRGRDGFVLGEGAWMLVLEREDRATRAARGAYARVEGYASTCDAYHRVQMDPDGDEIVRCIETALARAHRPPDGNRLRQLSRHVDTAERRDRVALRASGVREPRGSVARLVDEVDDRPPAGRQRRRRRRGHRAGARARPAAADHQPRAIRIRRATWTSFPTWRARPTSKRRSATASGSGRRTARWCWDACGDSRLEPCRSNDGDRRRGGLQRRTPACSSSGRGPRAAWRR